MQEESKEPRRVVIRDNDDPDRERDADRRDRRGRITIDLDNDEIPRDRPPRRGRSRADQTTKHADYVRFGESVTIDADERISGDVVAIGGTVVVNGTVLGDCVSVGGEIVLGPGAYVSRDVVSIGGNVTLRDSSEVGGDAVSVWGQVDVDPTADVYGEIVESGGVTFNLPGGMWIPGSGRGFGWDLWSLARRVIWVLVMVGIGLLTFNLFPTRMRRLSDTAMERGVVAFVAGLAGWVLLIPVFVILLITIVGIPLAILMVPLMPIVLLLGYLAVAQGVGSRIQSRSGNAEGLVRALVVGVLALEAAILLGRVFGLFGSIFDVIALLLTVLGHGIVFVAITTGFGAILISRFRPAEEIPITPDYPTGFGTDPSGAAGMPPGTLASAEPPRPDAPSPPPPPPPPSDSPYDRKPPDPK